MKGGGDDLRVFIGWKKQSCGGRGCGGCGPRSIQQREGAFIGRRGCVARLQLGKIPDPIAHDDIDSPDRLSPSDLENRYNIPQGT
jgi:hypothetical protein